MSEYKLCKFGNGDYIANYLFNQNIEFIADLCPSSHADGGYLYSTLKRTGHLNASESPFVLVKLTDNGEFEEVVGSVVYEEVHGVTLKPVTDLMEVQAKIAFKPYTRRTKYEFCRAFDAPELISTRKEYSDITDEDLESDISCINSKLKSFDPIDIISKKEEKVHD